MLRAQNLSIDHYTDENRSQDDTYETQKLKSLLSYFLLSLIPVFQNIKNLRAKVHNEMLKKIQIYAVMSIMTKTLGRKK